jgi:UTP:GlnB (protein PII) uridylyltransferase
MPWKGVFDWGGADVGEDLPTDFAVAFSSSMPARYGVLFDPRTIRQHAAISYRRGDRPAHAEVWRVFPEGSAAFCVVADDRPGLLSAIAAALVSHRLDVITALVYSRILPGDVTEAVDLLWVRRANPSDPARIGADEAASVGEVLSAILSGSITVEEIASRSPSTASQDAAVFVVFFEELDEDGCAVLHVEAQDRPGILLTIAFELYQHGTQIVRSLVRTVEGRAFNRFDLVEFSGAPLSSERREQIRAAVFAVLALQGAADHPRL